MSSPPGSLLELPDEPPRQWRGAAAAVVGTLVLVAAGVVLARTFALGGSTRPWPAVQLVVALPSMVVAWVLAGPHRYRTALTAAAMIVALAAQPLATAGIKPSPARLTAIVDGLGLPGETQRDTRVGNGRCRPTCSELRRTSVADGISYAKARARLEGTLRAHGFKVTMYGHRAGAPERIDAENDKLVAQFELRSVELTRTRIASVWLVRGRSSGNEVG